MGFELGKPTDTEKVAFGPVEEADGHRILVVEDEELLRVLLRVLFEQKRWRVTEAHNGVRALELLLTREFDILLADDVMPEMGGYELLAKVREKYPIFPPPFF